MKLHKPALLLEPVSPWKMASDSFANTNWWFGRIRAICQLFNSYFCAWPVLSKMIKGKEINQHWILCPDLIKSISLVQIERIPWILDEVEWSVKRRNAVKRDIGDQGRNASMRFPVICKRTDTSHWVLLLALKHNFVSLFKTFQKMVWIQPLSDPRGIHKTTEVTGFLLLFVPIQVQANVSVKCLSVFCQAKSILPNTLCLWVGHFNE